MVSRTFSKWIQWKELLDKKNQSKHFKDNLARPGVYVLAKFSGSVPKGNASPLCKEIIYVGETCHNTLKGRLGQFDKTAFYGKKQHSGGSSYRDEYKKKIKKKIIWDKGEHLYVAIHSVKSPSLKKVKKDFFRDSFIRYLEREIIYKIAKKNKDNKKQAPKLNKK